VAGALANDQTGAVKAVAYRLRCVLRARWRATLGMTLIVAAVSGVVLAFAAGAQRTSSAPDRFVAAHGPAPDGEIQQERGQPRTAEIAALPESASVVGATFVFGGLKRSGGSEDVDGLVFSGTPSAIGQRLVAGRDADPANPHEFVATRTFVATNGAAIGDTFTLFTLTTEQADAAGFSTTDPQGPSVDAVLVGITDGHQDAEDPGSPAEPGVVFSSSLLEQNPDIGVALTLMSVQFAPGVDLEKFREQLDSLPGGDSLSLGPGVIIGDSVRTAVQAQSRGLWLLAAVAAVAAVAALGQLLTRQVRQSPAERSRLSAIGFTKAQIVGESVARAAVPIVVGTLLGVGLAAAASDVFPTGFVRKIEPSPGLRFETVVLIAGAATLLVALLLWMLVALSSTGSRSRVAKPSALIERIATTSPSATASTGLRFAFMRGDRDVGSVRTAVGGLLMTVVGLVGALTFASSLERLVSDPARSGFNYDFGFGSGATTVSPELRAALDSDPDVGALTLFAEGQARVDAKTLRLIGTEPVKGELAPKVLAGRLPSSEDEIALGRLAAHAFGVHIGDDLTLNGAEAPRTIRVIGLAVVPSIGSNDGVGQDGIVTLAGLKRLDSSASASTAAVDLRPGAPPGSAERILRDNGAADPGKQAPPAAIQNLSRVRAIPYLLATLLGALGVLTVAHVMITSMRNRRRDVAIVRSLGADRSWITRAVHWQSTSFTLLPIAVGTPIGLILGQLVFKRFADSVGAVDDASIPFVLVAVIVVCLILLANVVAAVPARSARRLAPSTLLQSE
jgi:ABC-type lipoprotein release transport system permease subunit